MLHRNEAPSNDAGLLGKVPHQIRGFIGTMETLIISGQAYDQCTACSSKIKYEYQKEGCEFIRKICDNPKLLEEITGLKDLHEEVPDIIAMDDEDDDF
jgi:ubiquitin-like modifier-activating enzyme ATG7